MVQRNELFRIWVLSLEIALLIGSQLSMGDSWWLFLALDDFILGMYRVPTCSVEVSICVYFTETRIFDLSNQRSCEDGERRSYFHVYPCEKKVCVLALRERRATCKYCPLGGYLLLFGLRQEAVGAK